MSSENATFLTHAPRRASAPDVRLRHPASSIAKRAFDVVGASLALLVLLPLFVLVAVLVFAASPGRVLFRQHRVGRNGEEFRMVKFRSMVVDSERRLRTDSRLRELYLRHDFKIPAHLDTRITRVGRFIRSTSLDELPQLWNVVKGEMSLVGPRPVEKPQLLGAQETGIALYESVRPGLTGPWQASGRSTVSYDARVEMESDYVLNWSFRNDVAILLKTIPAVWRREGAH